LPGTAAEPIAGAVRTHEQQTTADGSSGDEAGRFFGYPDSALAGTWTVRDLQTFLRVSERKARELMRADGAPPPLRTGSERCDRWNPYQVIAWLHGSPHAAAAPAAVPAAADAAPSAPSPAPGRQWSPSPAPSGRAKRVRR
jgi:hypothetical protein